jgi:hypothetical protein
MDDLNQQNDEAMENQKRAAEKLEIDYEVLRTPS